MEITYTINKKGVVLYEAIRNGTTDCVEKQDESETTDPERRQTGGKDMADEGVWQDSVRKNSLCEFL